ncbi:hypothetical protein KC343_g9901 [Hortaea werneckii]|uniref:C2H2 type master regulator of conidiophore development brlA n=1 Tax=Hortaea werneckii TaxID=91943 RepID=A0A3M7HD73_HORWE|nr:hypothetical protein KC352_g16668 [Hortaea werneckii]KAI7563651.1 hypothetical protein KC317_g7596 [Hortaea werneckii]KAI7613879.1 hypothetical protein KC346_g7175 [Hortaea werneckii]KAI7616024.1 hypothetical protein KC343_g9901 [Hortaea werneckii]KAI7665627.1 hypothetical protein KC319_g7158 [Hortaea werneckii]
MSPPLTTFFEESTYNVGAWNDASLPDEQYQRMYHEIMTSDVALNPTCTSTYPQQIASSPQTFNICPSQTAFGWNLNNVLQDVEKQEDFAQNGSAQLERPGLGERSTESIVARVGSSQNLDNAMRLPPECSLVPLVPPEHQGLQPDTAVGFERTYAQVLRDPCPAQFSGQLARVPPTADFSQNAAYTPSANTPHRPTVPASSPLHSSTFQGERAQSSVPKLSLDTTGLLGIPITPQRSSSGTSTPISACSSRSARRTPDQMRAWPAPFRCDNEGCGLGFETTQDLRHHQRIHRPRRFICGTCDKAFHYFKDLRRHWKKHNTDPMQKFYCPFTTCKHHRQGFNRDDHSKRHMEKQHQHVYPALQQSSES